MRQPVRPFRSRDWFADPARSDMTALNLERFMNYALTAEALRSVPSSHTPWEELHREKTGQLSTGACLDFAVGHRQVAAVTPRHNH